MHLLRTTAAICAALFALFISCKSEGALTPEDAFKSITNAYCKSDAEAVVKHLSQGSIEKIKTITKMISSMNDNQLTALSKRYGVNTERIKRLSVKDYISIQLSIGKDIGDDVNREISKYSIIGIDIKGKRATVRVENGMELSFVKEGPYWKFDMEYY